MVRTLSQVEKAELTRSFVERYKGFAWSNPTASSDQLEQIILNRMLLDPAFHPLLDAAVALGLERVEEHWSALGQSADPDVQQAVARADKWTRLYLKNIRSGYEQALR